MCILTSVGIKNGKETKAILCSLISLPLINHFQYIIFFDNLRHDIPGGHFLFSFSPILTLRAEDVFAVLKGFWIRFYSVALAVIIGYVYTKNMHRKPTKNELMIII